jgi:hypothetical protein
MPKIVEKKTTRGGTRKGAGRPPIYENKDQRVKYIPVSIPEYLNILLQNEADETGKRKGQIVTQILRKRYSLE